MGRNKNLRLRSVIAFVCFKKNRRASYRKRGIRKHVEVGTAFWAKAAITDLLGRPFSALLFKIYLVKIFSFFLVIPLLD